MSSPRSDVAIRRVPAGVLTASTPVTVSAGRGRYFRVGSQLTKYAFLQIKAVFKD
jgi:hypothetical protein